MESGAKKRSSALSSSKFGVANRGVVVYLAANRFNGYPQHVATSLSDVLVNRVSGDASQDAFQLNQLEAWER